MSTILVCSDDSIYSTSVYKHAAWASKQMEQAAVHVLHMLDPHHEKPLTSDFSGNIGLGTSDALLEEFVGLEARNAKAAQKRGQLILDNATAALKEEGLTKITANQKHGKLSEEIKNYERDADLVVMGKRGNHADLEKGNLGKNLENVIRSCQHPVLVASRAFAKMENYVIAFDGSASAKKAVAFAATNTLLKGMHCYLLYVGSANSKIETALAEAKQTLTDAGYEVTIEHRDGEPEKVINEVVSHDHINLLVMGAYRHSPLRNLIVGSTTTAMIREVKIPVLLFR